MKYDYEKLWTELKSDVERWCDVGGWDSPEAPEIIKDIMQRREEQSWKGDTL